jgi:hypothetical protein
MSRVEALLREREGYVRRGLTERVAAVDAELARLGAVPPEIEAAAIVPSERATPSRARKTKG